MVDILRYLQEQKALVDEALARYLPGEEHYPPAIFQAMRYSVFAGASGCGRSWPSLPPKRSGEQRPCAPAGLCAGVHPYLFTHSR